MTASVFESDLDAVAASLHAAYAPKDALTMCATSNDRADGPR